MGGLQKQGRAHIRDGQISILDQWRKTTNQTQRTLLPNSSHEFNVLDGVVNSSESTVKTILVCRKYLENVGVGKSGSGYFHSGIWIRTARHSASCHQQRVETRLLVYIGPVGFWSQ